MRQVFQKSYLSKELCVEEVPAPTLEGTGVLVRNAVSLISPGTERATVSFARKNLLAKIRSQPERVQLLLRKMKQNGVVETIALARRKLENPIPMGYSSAGIVTEASPDMPDLKPGDRVACAGSGYANHADMIYIPKNLCVPLPDNLSLEEGSFVAPGAIALHGVRLAQLGLGETVLVIGLGLIGQLAAQLVQAHGATAIGIDLDPRRLETARQLGIPHAFRRSDPGLNAAIMQLTWGKGVDAVLITAATASNDPVFLAGELCRERGRVVVVGDVGMQVPRNLFYHKELSLLVSRSYGPGRYDAEYEQQGRDYPSAYVRWSERDNMAAFLQLAAQGKIQLKPLIEKRFPVAQAVEAYDLLANGNGQPQPLGILLEYPQTGEENPQRRLVLQTRDSQPISGQIGFSVIGAGNFFTGQLLPILKKESVLALRGIVSRTGLAAKNAGKQGGFDFCSTDADVIFSDNRTEAVLIATRHDSHAQLTCNALSSGKHVFVEKPLATNRDELRDIIHILQTHSERQLMVGFNRRFAPLSLQLKTQLDAMSMAHPLNIHYRVLAGEIPQDSWIHQHGGRVVGEICHFIDWCQFITNAVPVRVTASAVGPEPNRDIQIQLVFSDGSTAQIEYLMRLDPATCAALGKEKITVAAPGFLTELDEFKTLTLARSGKKKIHKLPKPDKGHAACIRAFIQSLQNGKAAIPIESLLMTTETTFAILHALQRQEAIAICMPCSND